MPRLHWLYSQSHCFKYIFSWLNKEKKGLIVLPEPSEMLLFGHQPVRTLGNVHTSAAGHPRGHVRHLLLPKQSVQVTPISSGRLSDVSR